MIANKTKKLVLDKETIAPLQPEQLDDVKGGISIISRSCCQRNSCNTKAAEV